MSSDVQTDDHTTGPKLWIVLARAYRALAEWTERSIASQGMCLSDFMVLEVLLHKGPMTMSAIAEKVLLANASMTAAVDRLDERGLVLRRSSDTDRRIRIVDLTAKGRSVISALYALHERGIEELMEGVSKAERNAMRNGLKKIGRAAIVAAHTHEAQADRKGL